MYVCYESIALIALLSFGTSTVVVLGVFVVADCLIARLAIDLGIALRNASAVTAVTSDLGLSSGNRGRSCGTEREAGKLDSGLRLRYEGLALFEDLALLQCVPFLLSTDQLLDTVSCNVALDLVVLWSKSELFTRESARAIVCDSRNRSTYKVLGKRFEALDRIVQVAFQKRAQYAQYGHGFLASLVRET